MRHTSDDIIAAILAGVWNEVGWLMHELDDPDNDKESVSAYRSAVDSWYTLERYLVAEVIRRLEEENQTKGTTYLTTGIGTHSSSCIIYYYLRKRGTPNNKSAGTERKRRSGDPDLLNRYMCSWIQFRRSCSLLVPSAIAMNMSANSPCFKRS